MEAFSNHGTAYFLFQYSRLLNMTFADDGGFQVCSDPETDPEGSARDDAAVRAEAAKNADQIPWPSVAKVQHENHERHLSKSQASPQ
jgi:hypothetical protein